MTSIKKQINMKSMTCRELGGACDREFRAETFEEIAEMSKKHGMEMFQKGDEPHLKAMHKMKELMNSSKGVQLWFDQKKKDFDSRPDV